MESNHTVTMDEGVRRSTSIEGLAKLRPVFKQNGVVTAGNSSQTSDGSAFVLVVSEQMVKQLNLEPIARLVSCSVGGVDPLYMGIGPCVAIPKALKQASDSINAKWGKRVLNRPDPKKSQHLLYSPCQTLS